MMSKNGSSFELCSIVNFILGYIKVLTTLLIYSFDIDCIIVVLKV